MQAAVIIMSDLGLAFRANLTDFDLAFHADHLRSVRTCALPVHRYLSKSKSS